MVFELRPRQRCCNQRWRETRRGRYGPTNCDHRTNRRLDSIANYEWSRPNHLWRQFSRLVKRSSSNTRCRTRVRCAQTDPLPARLRVENPAHGRQRRRNSPDMDSVSLDCPSRNCLSGFYRYISSHLRLVFLSASPVLSRLLHLSRGDTVASNTQHPNRSYT